MTRTRTKSHTRTDRPPQGDASDEIALALLAARSIAAPDAPGVDASQVPQAVVGSQPVRVLIVDDSVSSRKLLRIRLESGGFAAIEAADGLEALEVLERERVDGIISDILMPRMDGFQLCHEVRHHSRFNQLPFIIYTSTYTSPADERLALEIGADKYLQKPAPTNVLLEAVKEFKTPPQHGGNPRARPGAETVVLKEYSQALVRKLEERNIELKQAQTQLERLTEELEQRVQERTAALEAANIELEAFNQSVAHDLRNPLSVIIGLSGLVRADPVSATAQNSVGCINDAAIRMAALIEDLLKLSRIKQGELERKSCDLSVQAQTVAESLRRSDAQGKARFIIESGIKAHADGRLVRVALENLLANARKFSAKSTNPRIEFGQRAHEQPVIYFVRDNGVGFDMADAGKLFRPFERLHSKAVFPGTGIGLTIVHRVIMKHGGRIWAESQPGQGATFFFTLSADRISNRKPAAVHAGSPP